METASIPAAGVNVNVAASPTEMAGISSGDFMTILIKQLQFQDPFKPMSNEEMVSQMSTIRELELNTRLSGKLEQITDQQRFGSAAALIGKFVVGTAADAEGNGFPAEGIVTGVRFTQKGDVILELDSGDVLPLAKLEGVTDPEVVL
jgi:flagellar basal-body rod modification protein FlgD